jgi:hypothetical protein
MTLADYHGLGRSLRSYDQDHVCFGRLPPQDSQSPRDEGYCIDSVLPESQPTTPLSRLNVNLPGRCADNGNADYLGPGQ